MISEFCEDLGRCLGNPPTSAATSASLPLPTPKPATAYGGRGSRHEKENEKEKEADATGVMTAAAILKVCKQHERDGMYRTPELNEVLYLHYKGYTKIGGLDEYTEVRVLWLEGNAFTQIEGLTHQQKLRTLYLQENCIESLDTLDQFTLPLLDTLNVSDNFIHKIEGLSTYPVLRALHCKRNRLRHFDDLSHLLQCPFLAVIDLSNNYIEDPDVVPKIFAQLPNLAILHLEGNPVTRAIPHYRKTVIYQCQKLKHLDDRPVFDDERRMCNAWGVGGLEAEKLERFRIADEKEQKRLENMRIFDNLIADAKRRKSELDAKGEQEPPTVYYRLNSLGESLTDILASIPKNDDDDDNNNDDDEESSEEGEGEQDSTSNKENTEAAVDPADKSKVKKGQLTIVEVDEVGVGKEEKEDDIKITMGVVTTSTESTVIATETTITTTITDTSATATTTSAIEGEQGVPLEAVKQPLEPQFISSTTTTTTTTTAAETLLTASPTPAPAWNPEELLEQYYSHVLKQQQQQQQQEQEQEQANDENWKPKSHQHPEQVSIPKPWFTFPTALTPDDLTEGEETTTTTPNLTSTILTSAHSPPHRPLIYGTSKYNSLWAMACSIQDSMYPVPTTTTTTATPGIETEEGEEEIQIEEYEDEADGTADMNSSSGSDNDLMAIKITPAPAPPPDSPTSDSLPPFSVLTTTTTSTMTTTAATMLTEERRVTSNLSAGIELSECEIALEEN